MIDREKIGIFCTLLLLFFPYKTLYGKINWSAPATISSSNLDTSDPQIIISPQGNATAAWVENNKIKSSTIQLNGSWSTPATLSNALTAASSPKLCVDSSGNVTALWLQGGVVNSAIMNSVGQWGLALPVSSLLGKASSPALSVDSNGNAAAVWVRGGFIESATRTSGIWGIVTKFSAAKSDFPQVAISANGTVISVWHSVVSGADTIMSATKTLGGNWSSAKSVFSGTAALNHNYPKVAIDLNGNAFVVWFRYSHSGGSYQNVTVLTSSLTFQASSWTIPSLLSNPGLRNPADLMLKINCDSNGNTIAFWTNSYDGQVFNIESTAKLFGGPWSNSVMPYPPSLYLLAADVDVDSAGNVLATYMTWDGSALVIQSQESDIASQTLNAWTHGNMISQGSYNGYPRCSVALTGNVSNAAVVWINFNGKNSVINASVGSEPVVLPPTALKVTQSKTDFHVYTDFFNTITWQPSPSSQILQYNIYRNGVFFASTDPNTLQVVDHNTVQNGIVTYGIAAQDVNYSQSSIATITFP